MKGYRWFRTAPDTWQLEGPPRSRRFHGMVYVWPDGLARFCLPGGYQVFWSDGRQEEHGQGERATAQLAMDEVERAIREGGLT